MDYEKKYKEVFEKAGKELQICGSLDCDAAKQIYRLFPELKESKDERIRKSLIILLQHFCKGYRVPGLDFSVSYKEMLAWLKKQKAIDVLDAEEREFVDNVDSYRKEVDAAYQKGYNEGVKATLEQKSKNVSLWKHWKDGIAGNGEGELIYLVKNGNTYRLTSCLGCECDYIELSELDSHL